ncbi:hypothetical protein EJF36_16450 [Bacillus sp. HMF5848]|uniref:hypothetical protein n=1 Tax=Bacillus sp. HMF5848 TaxID=2495421 RepID=UPI000F772FDB|nr:hypothetical protein [Bacillus sp. HMF5848]RSK28325.1 hypothetical protein EJF36_16450 [Bacillus sp. HMF5848]
MRNYTTYSQQKKWIIFIELFVVITSLFVLVIFNIIPQIYLPYLLYTTVTLFGIRYGLLYGIISIIGTGCIYVLDLLINGYDLILVLYQQDLVLPFIFLTVLGVVTGLYRTSLNERYEDLLYQNYEVDDERKEIAETLHSFRHANAQLKKRVLESENNLATIYSMTQMLKKGQSEKVLDEAAEIIRSQYGAEAFGIYHVDQSEKVLRMKINMAIGKETMPNSIFFENAPRMFHRVLEDKRIFFKNFEESEEDKAPLIAAPIIIDHKVKYVLVIKKVDFYRMTQEGLEVLKWILQFITDPLTNTMKREKEEKNSVLVEGTSFYTMEYFQEILDIEVERYKLTQQPYTTFRFKMKKLTPEAMAFINKYLAEELREIDVIGFDSVRSRLYFLLPGTDPSHAESIKKRIIKSISAKEQAYEF